MQSLEVKEKELSKGLFQFIFPFSLREDKQNVINYIHQLKFRRYQLYNEQLEEEFYGTYSVSHRNLEAYYLPFTNKVLFPQSEKENAFQRYSKQVGLSCELKTETFSIPFMIHSVDITLCPYELGFLTIRTELVNDSALNLSRALEFAALFRILDSKRHDEKEISVVCGQKKYREVADFIFNFLFPDITRFFDRSNLKAAYFQSIPFFEDERMFVHSLVGLKDGESIDEVDAFRASDLNGFTKGKPFVSANNYTYVKQYLEENGYLRWAPNSYYVIEDHSFTCITDEQSALFSKIASSFYGEYYYALLLSLFHKIVLHKIASQYSEINVERDGEKIEELIHIINSFTANFFFMEMAAQSQGREILSKLRKMFGLDSLYNDARDTLDNLYRHQEKMSNRSTNILLLILTLYTVVSGIFGMNLAIPDLQGKINWHKLLSYSPFEYIAMFTMLSGLIIAIVLGSFSVIKWVAYRRKRSKWHSRYGISNK